MSLPSCFSAQKYCSRACWRVGHAKILKVWAKTPEGQTVLSKAGNATWAKRKADPAWQRRFATEIKPKMVAGWKASPLWHAKQTSEWRGAKDSVRAKAMWANSEMRAVILDRMAKALESIRADPEKWERYLVVHHAASKKKGNKIETQAQASLVARGVPFLANKVVEGICEADVVLTDFKIAIFCDGCYWHNCPIHGTNSPYIRQRAGLDLKFSAMLGERGWIVLRFWEHEFKEDPDCVGKRVETLLTGQSVFEAYKREFRPNPRDSWAK